MAEVFPGGIREGGQRLSIIITSNMEMKNLFVIMGDLLLCFYSEQRITSVPLQCLMTSFTGIVRFCR